MFDCLSPLPFHLIVLNCHEIVILVSFPEPTLKAFAGKKTLKSFDHETKKKVSQFFFKNR